MYRPQVIASLLLGCDARPCHSIDIGMSTGYFTAAMASLGSNVTSIERSTDMVAAFRQTSKLNCWEHRVKLLNAAVGLGVKQAPHPAHCPRRTPPLGALGCGPCGCIYSVHRVVAQA